MEMTSFAADEIFGGVKLVSIGRNIHKNSIFFSITRLELRSPERN